MALINELYKTDIAYKGDFQRTEGQGDFNTVSGLDNVWQALFHRLITVPGSLVHKPNYGIGIKRYQNGVNNITTQRNIAIDIDDQFTQDDRVKKIYKVGIQYDDQTPENTTIIVGVDLVGYGETEMSFTPFGGEA